MKSEKQIDSLAIKRAKEIFRKPEITIPRFWLEWLLKYADRVEKGLKKGKTEKVDYLLGYISSAKELLK